jgi:signal transduction histidine kinase
MASEQYCVVVCEHLAEEVARAAESAGLDSISVQSYELERPCPPVTTHGVARLDIVVDDGCERVFIVGGQCLAGLACAGDLPERWRIRCQEQCFNILVNPSLLDRSLSEGAYLLTPGWLTKWKEYMEFWEFDRETARQFFQESTSKLVLLDTGVDPTASANLASFSEFVGVPFEVLQVGLDYLGLFLTRLDLEWRLEKQESASRKALSTVSRRTADYEMVFDLIGPLAEISGEERVIEKIIELFVMLIAPERVGYAVVSSGRTERTYSLPDGVEIEPLADETPSGTRSGFDIDIAHGDELLGILSARRVAFPEYIDHYESMARTLAAVCGLGVANARTYARLELANVELDGFARTVSHDLKGPLSALVLAVETMRDLLAEPRSEAVDHDLEEIGDIISRNVGRSVSMVNDLLALAEAELEPTDLSPVPVRTVVDAVLDERRGFLEEYNVEILCDDDMGTVVANETHLYQIFTNLIGNALRHGLSDKTRITIRYLGEVDPGGHRYLVRDNGPGIPPESMERIFIPFFKEGSTGDTGIGLATVKKVVELYGGEITAFCDGGACFEFTLFDYPAAGA